MPIEDSHQKEESFNDFDDIVEKIKQNLNLPMDIELEEVDFWKPYFSNNNIHYDSLSFSLFSIYKSILNLF